MQILIIDESLIFIHMASNKCLLIQNDNIYLLYYILIVYINAKEENKIKILKNPY